MNPALTSAQLTTLKTDIATNFPGTANTPDGDFSLATSYNTVASPDFWVWRTSVSRDEAVGSTSVDGTVFSFVGTGYITRAQGERDAFVALFSSAGTVNASQPQVRQAFADIFSGSTAPAPANRTHLLTVARRKASRIEKLYGVGTGSTASPATMATEGSVTPQEIRAARNS